MSITNNHADCVNTLHKVPHLFNLRRLLSFLLTPHQPVSATPPHIMCITVVFIFSCKCTANGQTYHCSEGNDLFEDCKNQSTNKMEMMRECNNCTLEKMERALASFQERVKFYLHPVAGVQERTVKQLQADIKARNDQIEILRTNIDLGTL